MTRLALLLLLTSGCFKSDDGGLSDSEAKSAGDSLGTGMEDSAQAFGRVSDGTTADGACITLSGDTSDADMDNIPTNAKLTYNCTGMNLGFTATLTGTMGVVDNQTNAVAWAFTGTADLVATLTGPNGGSIDRDWSGQIVATQASPSGPFKLQRGLATQTLFTDARGRQVLVTESNDWAVTFTPMVSWTPGTLVVTGSLAATGQWNVRVEDNQVLGTITTPTPLTLDPQCFSRVTAGTVTGTYVDDNGVEGSINVTWSGCGVKTVSHAR